MFSEQAKAGMFPVIYCKILTVENFDESGGVGKNLTIIINNFEIFGDISLMSHTVFISNASSEQICLCVNLRNLIIFSQ